MHIFTIIKQASKNISQGLALTTLERGIAPVSNSRKK